MSNTTIIIIAVAAIVILLVSGAIGWFIFIYIPKITASIALDTAKTVKNVLGFTPQVVVNQRVVYKQTNEILELALIEQEFEVEHDFQDKRLRSEKRILLRGRYRAKIGFDLAKGFRVEVGGRKIFNSNTMTIHLPQAEILSIEEVEIQKFETTGWINWVTKKDRKIAVEQLTSLAHDRASKLDMLKDAENRIENRLTGFLLPKLNNYSLDYQVQFFEALDEKSIVFKDQHLCQP